MNFAQIVSSYISFNAMIVVALIILGCIHIVAKRFHLKLASYIELRLHYQLLGAIFFLTLIQPLFIKRSFFEPTVKIWSGSFFKNANTPFSSSDTSGFIAYRNKPQTLGVQTDFVSRIFYSLLALSLTLGLVRLARDLRNLFKMRRNSYRLRKVGNLDILASDEVDVPFSYWVPNHAYVIIPTTLVLRPLDFKMAIAHEAQHHRQGDTRWIYAFWFCRVLCVLNPAVHLWNRWVSELQEFACDEALVDQRKVESQQYARCLVEVAQNALKQKSRPNCALGLTFLFERNLLKRRILNMNLLHRKYPTRSIRWALSLSALFGVSLTALAANGLVQDRRITLDDAKKMAAHAESQSDFPITVNDLVLKQLNHYLGTAGGREFMRQSIERMQNHKDFIVEKIRQYKMPEELMAIPIVESGYQNLPDPNHVGYGAGLWMFITSTARTYGLRVDDKVDDRLDIHLETDAALRLLRDDHTVFNDWLLTLLGYNMGERNVMTAILKAKTRDAWALTRAGYENDRNYIAKVVAVALILKNPESLD